MLLEAQQSIGRVAQIYKELYEIRNLFQRRAEYTLVLSKQSNIELYRVKNILDQVEIGKYQPTYQDGITITQKQYPAKVCDQTLFFGQKRSLKSSW